MPENDDWDIGPTGLEAYQLVFLILLLGAGIVMVLISAAVMGRQI